MSIKKQKPNNEIKLNSSISSACEPFIFINILF